MRFSSLMSAGIATVLFLFGAHVAPNAVHADTFPGESGVSEAHFGNGYVVVVPEEDAPVAGAESDTLEIGDVGEDDLIVIAKSDGTLPLGEASLDVNSLDLTRLSKETLLNKLSSSMESVAPQAFGPQCASVTAWINGWANSQSQRAFIGMNSRVRIGYSYKSLPGTNQQAAVRGLGYVRKKRGTKVVVERRWSYFNPASGTSQRGTAPWGNVAALPQFGAKSIGIHLAMIRWCH